MHSKMKYRVKNEGRGWELRDSREKIWKYLACHWVWISRSRNTGGAFKGQYKSESSLMTCEAELHGLVTQMVSSILSLMGNSDEPFILNRYWLWLSFKNSLAMSDMAGSIVRVWHCQYIGNTRFYFALILAMRDYTWDSLSWEIVFKCSTV